VRVSKSHNPTGLKRLKPGRSVSFWLFRQIKALSGLKIKTKGARILGLS
jgi:hypothetical protein